MSVVAFFNKIKDKVIKSYEYCTSGVWNDTRSSFGVKIIKTINLAVNSFLDKNVQQRASALTYSTLLAIVPAFAMLFAIARGFGFQNILQSEIFKYFPSQSIAFQKVLTFVDSYLSHTSEGLFVGIGLIVLLWTLISLMMSVEDSFNRLWSVRKGRSLYRKITDYTAIFLVLPILMICESGITIFMATMSERAVIFSPLITKLLDYAPVILTWLIFAGAFKLIPYTKVQFKYALISGIISGTAFQVLQWIFVTGQMYVSKYNAIYGSFAFIPLLLIWLQLTWVITLTGVMLTYSAQNVFCFNFQSKISNISQSYYQKIAVIVMSIIVKRFAYNQKPLSSYQIAISYDLPHTLVVKILTLLFEIGYISIIDEKEDGVHEYQPAFDIDLMTVRGLYKEILNHGDSSFLESFDSCFKKSLDSLSQFNNCNVSSDTLLRDL